MRKQTKLAVVLAAAAVLALGASMSSFAAGWTNEGGQWQYLDSNGDPVTDTWKKSGNNSYYLGEDGYMLTNQLIEDGDNYYFVDGDGAMVKNGWRMVEADDDDAELDVEYRWYYFGATGRAYKDNFKKTINGKRYGFDADGKMLFGFVDASKTIQTDDDAPLQAEYHYADNTNGEMLTGWYNYTEGVNNLSEYDNKDSLWFYFKPASGVKYAGVTKTISGKKYMFDANGVMATDWDDGTGLYYGNDDDGHLAKKGWFKAVPSELMNATDYEDDKERWFYADSAGALTVNGVKRIKSKWYCFDGIGRMKAGLCVLAGNDIRTVATPGGFVRKITHDEVDGATLRIPVGSVNDPGYFAAGDFLYYFSASESDGAAKSGTVKIEMADDTFTFGFDKSTFVGSDGIKSKKLYVNGVLITAEDMKYAAAIGSDGNVYVVNGSGTVLASKTISGKKGNYAKDADDGYYVVIENATNPANDGVWYINADDEASKAAKKFIELEGDVTDLQNFNTGTATNPAYAYAAITPIQIVDGDPHIINK